MSIKHLNDKQLHLNLLSLKSKESQIVARIISHLEEVYRRRLFAHYKCSSLYDYCIRVLGYSNGDAHKKVSACKLSSRCEGIKESIARGELSLSNASSVQVFLNQASKSSAKSSTKFSTKSIAIPRSPGALDPQKIVDRVKNKTTRECEVELEKIAVENQLERPARNPSKRSWGDKTQLKIYLDRETLQLLKTRLKINCEQELLQRLINEKIESTNPQTEVKPKARKNPSQKPRSISPAKRARLFKKAQGRCENCGSKHALQIDHKVSVARGGGNSPQNLRVLCRSCNQRAAIEQLGLVVMDKFINKSCSSALSQHARTQGHRPLRRSNCVK